MMYKVRIDTLVFVLLALGSVAVSSLVSSPDFAGILVLLAVCLAIAPSMFRVKSRLLRSLLGVALAIRIGVALAGYFWVELPDSTEDAIRFQAAAIDFASMGWREYFGSLTTGAYLYSWLLAPLLKITQASVLSMIAVNVALGWWSVHGIMKLAEYLGGRRAAILATALLAIAPSLVLYSAVTMRESLLTLLLISSVSYMIYAFERRSAWLIPLAMTWAFIGVALHTAMIAHFAVLVGVALLFFARLKSNSPAVRRSKTWFSVKARFYIFALVLVSGLAILVSGVGLEKFNIAFANDNLLETLANQQDYAARSRAAYLDGLTVSSPVDVIMQLPIRVVYFLFAPFAWQVSNVGDTLAALDAVLYLMLFVWIVCQVVRKQFSKYTLYMTIVIAATISVFALTTSNYGTALRHRGKVLPLIVCIVSVNTRRTLIDERARVGVYMRELVR